MKNIKNIKLIFCADNKKGLEFNGRRQSQDREIRARVLKLAKDSRLLMSPYSARQFDSGDAVIADPNFMSAAREGDYCFIEDTEVTLENCDEVIIYVWNRDYPADRYFEFDLASLGFELISTEDFKGYSHERITEKIYKLKK